MSKAHGKLIGNYSQTQATKDYLKVLEGSMGYPIDPLVIIKTTGWNKERGTWVHPRVVMDLAMASGIGIPIPELVLTNTVRFSNRRTLCPLSKAPGPSHSKSWLKNIDYWDFSEIGKNHKDAVPAWNTSSRSPWQKTSLTRGHQGEHRKGNRNYPPEVFSLFGRMYNITAACFDICRP